MDKAKDTEKWRKKSRVVRKSSFEKVPKGFFSVLRTVTVDFIISNGRVLTLKCTGNHTVGQIKEQAIEKMYDTFPGIEGGCEFVLKYELNGLIYEICDQEQTFQTLRIVSEWSRARMKGSLFLSPQRAETNEERLFNIKLGSLMGVIWGTFQSISNDELYMTRRKFTNVRRRAVCARSSLEYAMEPMLETCQPSSGFLSKLQDERFMISIYGPNRSSTKIPVKMEEYPASVMKNYFSRLTPALRTAFGIPEGASYTDYVMKVCGYEDFIWGNYKMGDFMYIRECISRKKEPCLALHLPIQETVDDVPAEHDPWFLVDESTGLTEDHQQLTLRNKNHNEVVAFSMWDMTRKFRIKVCGIDHLSFADDLQEDPDEIYVEACLYHGQFQLSPPMRTEALGFNDTFR